MLRPTLASLSICAAVVVAMIPPVVARSRIRRDQPSPEGLARIAGRIVAADDGRPIKRVSISLSGRPDALRDAQPDQRYVTRVTETDTDGRYEFGALQAGVYAISVNPAVGFVGLAGPRQVVLTEEGLVDVSIRLERTGAIEGQILDDNGDAIVGVEVQAVRLWRITNPMQVSAAGQAATTNDLGRFRVFGLPAGDYYVIATQKQQFVTHRVPPPWGYPPTYYPGSLSRESARIVAVHAGQDTGRVNFALARRRTAQLSIHPLDSRGMPLGDEAHATLTRYADFYLPSSTDQVPRQHDGTFTFTGIVPGNYYLVVASDTKMTEAAYVNVAIDEVDLSLNVRTNKGARVSGRVIVDGQPANSPSVRSANVSVAASQPSEKYGPTYAQMRIANVRGTDEFELTGLRGPMVLSAEISSGAFLSIKRGGEEISGKIQDFTGTEVIDDIVVELTRQVGQVEATVHHASASAGADEEPVLVVLFPEDPAKWHAWYLHAAKTTTSSGRTDDAESKLAVGAELIRIPEGRYLVAAIKDIGLKTPTARDVLERLRPKAVPVTVLARQKTKVAVMLADFAR